MILKIAQLGQPVLRLVAQEIPVEEILTDEFQALIDNMLETLDEEGGVGLAAPQVFASRRMFLAEIAPPEEEDDEALLEVFVNPTVVPLTEETEAVWEGCLSFPELQVLVPRCKGVRIDYHGADAQPRSLELWDFAARVVQHEYDHLEGILTLDRAESTRDIVKTSEIDEVRKLYDAK